MGTSPLLNGTWAVVGGLSLSEGCSSIRWSALLGSEKSAWHLSALGVAEAGLMGQKDATG